MEETKSREINNSKRPQLHNYMEDLVWEKLDELLKDYPDVCDCPQCRKDMATYALNHLPPRYISSHHGELYSRLDQWKVQFSADLIMVLLKAIKLISENPRHE